jgi:hypothetical protein
VTSSTDDPGQARRVHVAPTLDEAHAVKEALEGAGFACTVQQEAATGDDLGDERASVWVPDYQAERAIRLLAESQEEPADAADWTCPGCGEQIEGQFTDCWQCGTARP